MHHPHPGLPAVADPRTVRLARVVRAAPVHALRRALAAAVTSAAGLLAALTVLGAVAIALLTAAPPAAAHGDTIRLDVSGQDNGRVTTVATWENDRDPVTEEFAGTLSATSADGRTAGPWRLVPLPGHPGTYTTREILPAGHWKITVDCAFPSLGHGSREMDIPQAAIVDPPLPTPTTGGTPGPGNGTATATVTATATRTAGPTAGSTAGPGTAPVPASPSASAAATTTAAGAGAGSGSGDDDGTSAAATWAAIVTAAAAVILVTVGYRMRSRAQRPMG